MSADKLPKDSPDTLRQVQDARNSAGNTAEQTVHAEPLHAGGGVSAHPPHAPTRTAAGRTLSVKGLDGLRLNAVEWPGNEPTCLLIHGVQHDTSVWDDLLGYLQPLRVVALDLPGHGDSDWDPQARYGASDMAASVEAVIDQLAVERLVLIGHSLGGWVSAIVAGQRPDHIAALVIVDNGPELKSAGLHHVRESARSAPRSFASVEAYAAFLALVHPLANPHALARMARTGLRPIAAGRFEPKADPRTVARPPAQAPAPTPDSSRRWNVLQRIRCPTLVVRGTASSVLGRDVARRMVSEALPRGTLVEVERAGHAVMLDNRRAFGAAVTDFLERVLGAAETRS